LVRYPCKTGGKSELAKTDEGGQKDFASRQWRMDFRNDYR
jgi:hypothetical protein